MNTKVTPISNHLQDVWRLDVKSKIKLAGQIEYNLIN